MEYEKYVVPILASNEHDKLTDCDYNGTGFIVGEYLITAGHVVAGFNYVGYKFDGKIHLLSKLDFLELGIKEYSRYNQISIDTSLKEDMALFKIGECGSPLRFSFKEEDMSCMYYGYSLKNDSTVVVDRIDSILISSELNTGNKTAINCKELKCNAFHRGNSGGPLFHDDLIVGMLVSATETTKRCLSSWYMQDKICSIKNNKLELCS